MLPNFYVICSLASGSRVFSITLLLLAHCQTSHKTFGTFVRKYPILLNIHNNTKIIKVCDCFILKFILNWLKYIKGNLCLNHLLIKK